MVHPLFLEPRQCPSLHDKVQSDDGAPESYIVLGECQTMELVKTQEKHAALQETNRVQAGMLRELHAYISREQQAFEDTQVAWGRQQDQELAALKRMLSKVRALSTEAVAEVAQDYCEAEEEMHIHEIESALSNAKIEALEAEQERAEWEERARRTMDESSVILREERFASASRTEHLKGLLSAAKARVNELDEECGRQARRADRAEARAGQLEDEMRAAKALWCESQQRERDWEETAAFLKAQLTVAQSQVRIAKLRLSQQQAESLVAPPPTNIAISASPSIGYASKQFEVDGKENDWQALRRTRVFSTSILSGSKSAKQVFKKRSVRILPPGSISSENAGTEGSENSKQRSPLKEITNRKH